jgi:hypothetical protein
MKLKVIRNTYPARTDVAHAEPGDVCKYWPRRDGGYNLERESDGQTVYSSPRRLTDSPMPPVVGVIASVKSRGWYLEVERID